MSAFISESSNLAIAHAVSFLTRPLVSSAICSATTLLNLQRILHANLLAISISCDTSGFTLAISSLTTPPPAIHAACIATGVQWSSWIDLLSRGRSFDLTVNPSRVLAHVEGQTYTIWSSEALSYEPRIARGSQKVDEETIQARIRAQAAARARNMTFAEQLMEEDKRADDELFSMIKIATMKRTLALEEKPTMQTMATTTTTPIPIRLPIALPIPNCRAFSPLRHSSPEPSSGSDSDSDSGSDSGFSFTSKGSSVSSVQSSASKSATDVHSTKKYVPPHRYTRPSPQPYSQTARKTTRSRVFVDSTKTQVTPYDGGKTTVLTGGVMLGGASSSRNANDTERRWRRASVRNQ